MRQSRDRKACFDKYRSRCPVRVLHDLRGLLLRGVYHGVAVRSVVWMDRNCGGVSVGWHACHIAAREDVVSAMRTWIDDADRRVAAFVFWPWNLARGRSLLIRLCAVIFGWLWVVPTLFLVYVPIIAFVFLPATVWQELRDGY